jgi:hypothetical protein
MNGDDDKLSYDEAVEEIARRYGVPRSVYSRMVGQESGGNDNAVSPKGASSRWQIMPATAKGLGIDSSDPLQAAEGGLRILRDNYKRFRKSAQNEKHAWMMAVAGYHGSPRNVERDLKSGGYGLPEISDGAITTRDHVLKIFDGLKGETLDRNPFGKQTQSSMTGGQTIAPSSVEFQPVGQGQIVGDVPLRFPDENTLKDLSFPQGQIQAQTTETRPAPEIPVLNTSGEKADIEAIQNRTITGIGQSDFKKLPKIDGYGEARVLDEETPVEQETRQTNAPRSVVPETPDNPYKDLDLTVDVDNKPENLDIGEHIFRQAAKLSGQTLFNRYLDDLEVNALTELQRQQRGGFLFDNKSDKPLEKPVGDVYTVTKESLALSKKYLEQIAPELEKQRNDILAKRIAGGLDFSEEDFKSLERFGINREKVNQALKDDSNFAEARALGAKNREIYRQNFEKYSQDNLLEVADLMARRDVGLASDGDVLKFKQQIEESPEYKRQREIGLSIKDINDARRAGKDLNKGGLGSELWAGTLGATGRFGDFFAGVTRPLTSLGIETPYQAFAQMGETGRVINAEAMRDKGFAAQFANMLGGAPIDLPRFYALTKLPSGSVLGFATDAALQSAGRGESVSEISKEALKGATLGAIFSGAGKLSQYLEKGALSRLIPPAEAEAILSQSRGFANVAERNAFIVSKILGEGSRLGAIGAGTGATELISGASPEEALKQSALMALFDLTMMHGKKPVDLAGKVFKIWKGGKSLDVTVDKDGNAITPDKPVPSPFIDGEIIIDANNPKYAELDRQFKNAKNITPEKPVSETRTKTDAETSQPGTALTIPDNLNKVAPVAETPETLRAQTESTLKPDSPRVATLFTKGADVPSMSALESDSLFDVTLPETGETLRFSKEKAKRLFNVQDLPYDPDARLTVSENAVSLAEVESSVASQLASAYSLPSEVVRQYITEKGIRFSDDRLAADKDLNELKQKGVVTFSAKNIRELQNRALGAQVQNFVRENGYASLIGKAENVGSDTDTGAALVARDAQGGELSASKVTTPETLRQQAEINRAEFGNVNQNIESPEQVINDRNAKNGAILPPVAPSVQTIEAPHFAKQNLSNPQGAESNLVKDFETVKKSGYDNESLFRQAEIETRGGITYLNPQAAEIVRRGLEAATGEKDLSVFTGAYLTPSQVESVISHVAFNMKQGEAPGAKRFVFELAKGVDSTHGDLITIPINKELPNGFKPSVQEELSHRADFRSRNFQDYEAGNLESSEVFQKAKNTVRQTYDDVSETTLKYEVVAKTFRDDAVAELGISADEVVSIQAEYFKSLQSKGVSDNDIVTAFESVSPRGKEFSKYVSDRRIETGRRENERSGESENDSPLSDISELRREGFDNRKQTFAGNADKFSKLRQTEIATADRSGNANSLTVKSASAILARPSVAELDPEFIAAEAEDNFRRIFSYIYDGKRDVPIHEAAMNIVRTGFLAGVSVIKTNLQGNTVNIAFEQLSKPAMAIVDIANAKLSPKAEGRRYVPGLSAGDIVAGVFGRNGLIRGGLIGDKGFLTALVKGVDTNEAARVDMNNASPNPNFVRNTGVPLIDVIIEGTKRLVVGVDRPFKAFAWTAEMRGLARIEAKNAVRQGLETDWKKAMRELQRNPTELMQDIAERYAETVTFQNPNAATAAYDNFRRLLVDEKALAKFVPNEAQRRVAKYVGAGAYIATGTASPFVTTPTNIGFRTMEYFAPTGAVIAAAKFYRIGQTVERQSYVKDTAANRAAIVKRLARMRGQADKTFNGETQKYFDGFDKRYKQKMSDFDAETEAVKNSQALTDSAKVERYQKILQQRKDWLNAWQAKRDSYSEKRGKEFADIDQKRKEKDENIKEKWNSEDAYADIKFTAFENRAFIEAAGRAGFGATVGGLLLLGVIYGLIEAVGTTDYDDESGKWKAKRKAGIPDNSVKIGGYRTPFDNQPFGNAMKLGINLFEQYERPGKAYNRFGAMAERFGKDVSALSPLTSQEFTKDDWSSFAGSKANSMTPILNMKILQEIGEVMDEKPRKYWEEGFAAQYLIKIPIARQILPESESFIGGNQERGGAGRRFLRMVDPLKLIKEKSKQKYLPNTPLEKKKKDKSKKDELDELDELDDLKDF